MVITAFLMLVGAAILGLILWMENRHEKTDELDSLQVQDKVTQDKTVMRLTLLTESKHAQGYMLSGRKMTTRLSEYREDGATIQNRRCAFCPVYVPICMPICMGATAIRHIRTESKARRSRGMTKFIWQPIGFLAESNGQAAPIQEERR